MKRHETYKDAIEKFGCSVIGVFDYEDEHFLPFSYSVGFAKSGFPDVIMVGDISHEISAKIINILYAQWSEKGFSIGINNELLQGLPVNLQPCDMNKTFSDNYVIQALDYYESNPSENNLTDGVPRFLQIVWTDKNGVFPYQEGYDKRMRQPLFFNKVTYKH